MVQGTLRLDVEIAGPDPPAPSDPVRLVGPGPDILEPESLSPGGDTRLVQHLVADPRAVPPAPQGGQVPRGDRAQFDAVALEASIPEIAVQTWRAGLSRCFDHEVPVFYQYPDRLSRALSTTECAPGGGLI